ncbi:OsmC family protein [Glaciecola sp. MH2013]|uniref:OsmC family protein n=1 Tax=Glaciecola sp. MH2013 TaxID=2785524 RepID=UPI0018A01944|nr:OsmC family protein [Glaciecola sp. MH2013]MBF7072738.1 OsmC family protein [Glaciecola sp. MH2013]
MKTRVDWIASKQGLGFQGVMDNGHTLDLDGNGEGLSPMEAVLMSVGACSSVDVVEIMRKSRQNMTACYCELEAIRAESPPRKFTHITAHFVVEGMDINEKHLARAVQLSTEKYCSVMLMLAGNVDINTSYEIKTAE